MFPQNTRIPYWTLTFPSLYDSYGNTMVARPLISISEQKQLGKCVPVAYLRLPGTCWPPMRHGPASPNALMSKATSSMFGWGGPHEGQYEPQTVWQNSGNQSQCCIRMLD